MENTGVSMKSGRSISLAWLAALFACLILGDQVTKYLAVAHLTGAFEHHGWTSFAERLNGFASLDNLDNFPRVPGARDYRTAPKVFVPGCWNFKYVENPGAAWGFLATADERFRVPFFHVVSLLSMALIAWFFRHVPRDQSRLRLALTLVLGGAVGNYLDRIMHGYVIDFIDWHYGESHFPTFNVADTAITIGASLMLIDAIASAIHARRFDGQEPACSPLRDDGTPEMAQGAAEIER